MTTNDWPAEGITCAGQWVTRDRETWRRIDTLPWNERAGAGAVASYSARIATPDAARDAMRKAEEGLGAVMRRRPPNAAEVRAVERLWREDDARALALCCDGDDRWFETMRLCVWRNEAVPPEYDDRQAAKYAHGYLMLSPTGPVPWFEVARLVAEMEGER